LLPHAATNATIGSANIVFFIFQYSPWRVIDSLGAP